MSDSTAETGQPGLAADAIHLHWMDWGHGAGRDPLRRILARYLNQPHAAIQIVQADPSDKPRLADGHEPLQFNWSHSRDTALVAVARDVPLGVDIETEARRVRALELARRFYAPEESTWLESLPKLTRGTAFLRLWTGKEAVLKALGHGIGNGLDRVVLTTEGSQGLGIERIDLPSIPASAMHLQAIEAPRPGLLAALAWTGPARRIVQFRDTLSH